ncbi:MAG: class I SAM-dependent methyltransferase [Dehalococcoidia bacterium]|nr:MAG: class I SAM-dependent methyltransferase [Dehalococcoidia bacterium]
MDSKNRVQWVYSSKDNEELEARYDHWAKDYDQDLAKDFTYRGPPAAVEYFARYVRTDAKVLDAGAGTGLVGEILSKMGYCDLIAMDMSQDMLREARKKKVYKKLHRMVMGETLGFKTNCFDAVICVGTLTLGHAPASSLYELVRITKPGGCIVYTLRPDIYQEKGFEQIQAELESAGSWKLVEESDKIQILPKGEPDIYHQVWVYQVI